MAKPHKKLQMQFTMILMIEQSSSHYIGITNKFVRRLFREHNVPRKDHQRIHDVVINKKHVRAVEKHFLNKGIKGDTGEETDDSI